MATGSRAVRASSSKRGYGWPHQKLRAKWKLRVDAGEVVCRRCGRLIMPGEPWDLGHGDTDRSVYTGPEHRRCNRATSTHRRLRRLRGRWSRIW